MPLAHQRGGAELMLLQLLRSRSSRKAKWFVVFLQDGPMVQQVRDLSIEAIVIRAGRLRHLHTTFATEIRLASYLLNRRIDLVVGWMGKAHLYSAIPAFVLRVPTVWYQLGLPAAFWMDQFATRLPANAILAVSVASGLAQEKLRPRRPIHVVHPGVEIDRFDAKALPLIRQTRLRLGLPPDRPLIGTVGRLQRWKGMHLLIEAMPTVLGEYPTAHCVIVGGGHSLEPDYEVFLHDRIRALSLDGHVQMVGQQRNVEEWMQAMDVFVHASDAEPFGMVLIEAMALGKPVISTSSGGPLEIIEDGVNGLALPGATSEELANGIKQYLNDAAFAARIGEAAKLRARNFSTEHYADKLITAALSTLG